MQLPAYKLGATIQVAKFALDIAQLLLSRESRDNFSLSEEIETSVRTHFEQGNRYYTLDGLKIDHNFCNSALEVK